MLRRGAPWCPSPGSSNADQSGIRMNSNKMMIVRDPMVTLRASAIGALRSGARSSPSSHSLVLSRFLRPPRLKSHFCLKNSLAKALPAG